MRNSGDTIFTSKIPVIYVEGAYSKIYLNNLEFFNQIPV